MFHVENQEHKVYLLRKALYSLKQSLRVWYQTLSEVLQTIDFKRTESDHVVFVSKGILIAIYVEDILIFSKHDSQLKKLQKEPEIRFRMTDLGEVSHYLVIAMDVDEEKSKITLSQAKYLKKVLNQFNMQDCRPVSNFKKPGTIDLLFP